MASPFAGVRARTQYRKGQPCKAYPDNLAQIIIEKGRIIVHRRVGDGDKRAHKDDKLSPQAGVFGPLQFE